MNCLYRDYFDLGKDLVWNLSNLFGVFGWNQYKFSSCLDGCTDLPWNATNSNNLAVQGYFTRHRACRLNRTTRECRDNTHDESQARRGSLFRFGYANKMHGDLLFLQAFLTYTEVAILSTDNGVRSPDRIAKDSAMRSCHLQRASPVVRRKSRHLNQGDTTVTNSIVHHQDAQARHGADDGFTIKPVILRQQFTNNAKVWCDVFGQPIASYEPRFELTGSDLGQLIMHSLAQFACQGNDLMEFLISH